MFNYTARVDYIVDGDTCDLEVDLGFRIFNRDRFRLIGINAPERGKPGFNEAKAELARLLPLGSTVTIATQKPLQDKYGRWLAHITADGVDVNAAMVSGGFAVPYWP